jgi:formylglycine-generating enzyme required for sulfatase activity
LRGGHRSQRTASKGGVISIRTSTSAVQFDKVLRAFETGGFTYLDVRSQLKQILAKGASPGELIETLRRRERFEPLPQHAHEEVLRLLNDAAEQSKDDTEQSDVSVGENPEEPSVSGSVDAGAGAAPFADQVRALQDQVARQSTDYETLLRAFERTKDVQTAASERVTALASELATATRSLEAEQTKTREFGKALAERSASAEAHQTRGEELLQKTRDYEAELRTVRESLAVRDAELNSIRHEHAKLRSELQERDQGAPQLLADLHTARSGANALAADLADARALLETEQHKAMALEKAHAEVIRAAESLRNQTQETLRTSERHEAEAKTLRFALAERDAKLARLQQDQVNSAVGQETSAKSGMQLQADLSAARARADALLIDLNASRGAAASLDAQLKRTKFDLDAARTELAAVKAQAHSYFDLLRTHEWRRASEHSATARDEDVAATGQSAETLRALNDQLQSRLNTVQIQLEQRDDFIAQLRAAKTERLIEPAPIVGAEPAMTAVPAEAAVEPTDMEIDLQPGGLVESGSEVFEQPLPSMQAAPPPLVVSGAWRPPSSAGARSGPTGRRLLALGIVIAVVVAVIWLYLENGNRAPLEPVVATGAAPGAVIHDCADCPTMVILPSGRFKQGDKDPSSFDKPVHSVVIAHPFAMSMNAVTMDEFAAFVTATGRDMQGCDIYDGSWKHDPSASWNNPGFAQTGAHPATCASWNDAQAYANWISSKSGHHYRLPSASEWEYAARAGAEAAAPWGTALAEACASANVADQSAAQQFPGWAVFGCSDGFVYTAPVGSFKINTFGLNDMLGNVFQWTQDCWNANYVGAPVDGSARADGNCAQRELRGGSWFSNPSYVSANYRNHFAADYRTSSVGIRVVRELDQ